MAGTETTVCRATWESVATECVLSVGVIAGSPGCSQDGHLGIRANPNGVNLRPGKKVDVSVCIQVYMGIFSLDTAVADVLPVIVDYSAISAKISLVLYLTICWKILTLSTTERTRPRNLHSGAPFRPIRVPV